MKGVAISGQVFVDTPTRARLRATGKDVLDLVHRLSTQDLKDLPVGSGRPTVLTSAKGRIVERLFVHRVAESDVLLLGGVGKADAIWAHLTKYTFTEDTGLADVTAGTVCFALPGSSGAGLIPDPGPWGTLSGVVEGIPVVVLGEDGYTADGRTVLAAADERENLHGYLSSRARAIDDTELERWRIERGYPGTSELTEDWNPLEAGLRDHVSFNKGCYVGQEVVARLNTYDRVSRRIVRLRFEAADEIPASGSELRTDDRVVGRLTSAVRTEDGGAIGLAYLKVRELPLSSLRVGELEARVLTD